MSPDTTNLDQRLPAIRVRDVILAALQAAFAREDLIGNNKPNPYLFVRNDPAQSPVWISTPEGQLKQAERDGKRRLVTVTRGDYIPSELHQHNYAGGWHAKGQDDFKDLGTTQVSVQCQDGSETGSEVLASICYFVLKLFRRQLMEEYDITNLHVLGISPPIYMEQTPGQPWLSIVNLRVEVEEHARMLEISNRLNRLDIAGQLTQNATVVLASLDGTPA